jgi:hypothetical protein
MDGTEVCITFDGTFRGMNIPPLRVCVTGAAGQIAYSLLPHICAGRTFGPNRRVILHLMDIERAQTVRRS